MNCNYDKCKKEISRYYTCDKCAKCFCSNLCLNSHISEIHTIVATGVGGKRSSGMRSIFMKLGTFSKEIINEPYYDFANFEIIKNTSGSLKNIGSGAFGEVYLAKNKKDGKFFAIKQMDKNKIIESGANLDIIYREISIHRRIQHENIVKLYSHFEDEKTFYLIMDYVNSGTLFNVIKKTKGTNEKKAFRYFIQSVAAVFFLHENNLVHRDLKPENLLVDQNDGVQLCDFGWCVDITGGNRITFCGTYEYMAPEIIKEMPYDHSIDVWSLGILLYELIHGYSPFRSQNEENEEYAEIFKNIIKYNFKIDKDISLNCKDLINKLLTPDNKSRIRIKDIFSHPWVQEFEKEAKEEKIRKAEELEKTKEQELLKKNNNLIANDLISFRSTGLNEQQVKFSIKSEFDAKLQIFDKSKTSRDNNLEPIKTLKNENKILTIKKRDTPIILKVENEKENESYNLLDIENSEIANNSYSKFKKNIIGNSGEKKSITSNRFSGSKKDTRNNIIIHDNIINPKEYSSEINTNTNKLNLSYNILNTSTDYNNKQTMKIKTVDLIDDLQNTYNCTNAFAEQVENEIEENLFDAVLNQVAQKNQNKRKKGGKVNASANINTNDLSVDGDAFIYKPPSSYANEKIDKNILKEENTFNINSNFANNKNTDELKYQSYKSQGNDDIYDETYSNKKKKEFEKNTYIKSSNDLLEKEIRVSEYNKLNKKNVKETKSNNHIIDIQKSNFNTKDFLNDEDFQYPNYKANNNFYKSPSNVNRSSSTSPYKKNTPRNDQRIKDVNKEYLFLI